MLTNNDSKVVNRLPYISIVDTKRYFKVTHKVNYRKTVTIPLVSVLNNLRATILANLELGIDRDL